jgi:DNA-directed RNA polymerase subunit RPC12/RpoP
MFLRCHRCGEDLWMDSAKVVELKTVGLLRCPRCGEKLDDGEAP